MAERAGAPAQPFRCTLTYALAALLALLVLSSAGFAQPAAAPPGNDTIMRIGSDYRVPAGATHAGTIVVFGGNVAVDGVLQGRAITVGGAVYVSGTVSGDVVALGGRIVLLPGSSVIGSVTAIGGGVERAANADLRGEVNSISLAQGLHIPQFRLFPFNLKSFPVYSLYLFGLYLAALIVLLMFPEHTRCVEHTLTTRPGWSAGVGLAAILLIVPLTVLMAFSVVGLPLVLLLWIAFFIAKLLGYVACARAFGLALCGRRFGRRLPAALQLAIGVVGLGFLRAVPYIGFLLGVLVLILGLGAALISRFGLGGSWWPFPRRRIA